MIVGNQSWQQALNQQVKQPLYVFEIPDFGIVLATFSTESGNVNVGGYGVSGHGIGTYGT